MIMHIATRIAYTPENRQTNRTTMYSDKDEDTVCTKKRKTHLYWVWQAADFYDLNPTMFFYLAIWFVPALLSTKHRSIISIVVASFFVAVAASIYNGEIFTLTSLWCYVSVPIVFAVFTVLYFQQQKSKN
jgi:hypothetical protein